MSSIRSPEDLENIVARVRKLEPDRAGLWGRMNAHEALCHMSDQLRVATGELESSSRFPIFVRPWIRFLAIHTPLPVPRARVQTVPVMLTSKPRSWSRDRDNLLDLIHRVARAEELRFHPAFGSLTLREWGILAYRHLDHHLRQFGV